MRFCSCNVKQNPMKVFLNRALCLVSVRATPIFVRLEEMFDVSLWD